MIKNDALKSVKNLQAYLVANQFANKVGADPIEYSDEKITKFKCQKRGDTTTINIFGAILPFDDGLEMVEQIQNIETDYIKVNINSPGGFLLPARAVANALMEHPAEVTTVNTALAASAASIIFAAGDNRVMQEGSQLMIHQVMGGIMIMGNKDDMIEGRKILDDEIALLKKFDEDLANTYTRISNLSKTQVLNAMNKETFYTGEEAVENQMATELQKPRKTNKKSNTINESAVEAVNLLRNLINKNTS